MKKWKKVKEVLIVGCVLGSFHIIDSWSNLGSIQGVRKGLRRSTGGKQGPKRVKNGKNHSLHSKTKKQENFRMKETII